MYERFTDRACKVMLLAHREAEHFDHEYLGTEHILLGLVSEGHGVASFILKNLGISFRRVTLEVETIVQFGSGGERVVSDRLPHTPWAKKVIDYALEEAEALNHNYVGT
jgi:ATP-dependent Clp protease ATP-binding subunit ClpC